jgi:hypothetical protein
VIAIQPPGYPPQLHVLFLQVLQLLGLFQPQAAVFSPPAVERLFDAFPGSFLSSSLSIRLVQKTPVGSRC